MTRRVGMRIEGRTTGIEEAMAREGRSAKLEGVCGCSQPIHQGLGIAQGVPQGGRNARRKHSNSSGGGGRLRRGLEALALPITEGSQNAGTPSRGRPV